MGNGEFKLSVMQYKPLGTPGRYVILVSGVYSVRGRDVILHVQRSDPPGAPNRSVFVLTRDGKALINEGVVYYKQR